MSETVKKVLNACRWGSPNTEVTEEIVGEVQALVDANLRLERLVTQVLRIRDELAGDDGGINEGYSLAVHLLTEALDDKTV